MEDKSSQQFDGSAIPLPMVVDYPQKKVKHNKQIICQQSMEILCKKDDATPTSFHRYDYAKMPICNLRDLLGVHFVLFGNFKVQVIMFVHNAGITMVFVPIDIIVVTSILSFVVHRLLWKRFQRFLKRLKHPIITTDMAKFL